MKTESKQDGRSQRDLHVSRSGRVVKRAPRFKEPALPPSRGALCGRWTVASKESLLTCLNRYESVQYSPLVIWRSIRNRPKNQVLEFMLRLRKKAAAHSEQLRKKQPPILTWFQAADEVSWLKDDEDLYTSIVPLLSVLTVEANSRPGKNKVVSYSKLYKYLRLLHKDEVLPELTPAESVVLLDCFQHLADTLRTSDTKAQTEFMMNQYEEYFQLLYFAHEGVAERRIYPGKGKTAPRKPPRRARSGQSSSQRPLMKAELRPKKSRRGGKTKKTEEFPIRDDYGSQVGQDNRQTAQAEQGAGQRLQSADQSYARTADGGRESPVTTGNRKPQRVSDPGGGQDVVRGSGVGAGVGREESAAASRSHMDYGCPNPEDPQFLSKFAGMFSLGSLNPFEIPTELINIRPKGGGNEDEDDYDEEGDDDDDVEEVSDNDDVEEVSDGEDDGDDGPAQQSPVIVVNDAPPSDASGDGVHTVSNSSQG